MAKQKPNFIFHNPNTNEETIKYISNVLAEIAVSKVIKLQQAEASNMQRSSLAKEQTLRT